MPNARDALLSTYDDIDRRLRALEVREDTGELHARIGALERRVTQLLSVVEGQGSGNGKRIPARDLEHGEPLTEKQFNARFRELRIAALKAGHDPGPWTEPATLERPVYSVCRICQESIILTIFGEATIPPRCATPTAKPPPRREPMRPIAYGPKACVRCHRAFTPTHNRQVYCRQESCDSYQGRRESREVGHVGSAG